MKTERCECCGKKLEAGQGQIVWTRDEVPLCVTCARELSKEKK